MKILLDHSTPRVLRRYLSDHVVDTAAAQGWSDLSNGDLLEHAVEEGYEVLITTDQNMRYQQNLDTWPICVVVIMSNRWPLIQPRVGDVRATVSASKPGQFTEVAI